MSAAPAALHRYLAAVPAMSLIPFAPFFDVGLTVHGVIELREEVFVLFLALFRCEAQWVDAFNTDLFHVGLAFQDRHGFVEEFVQRHRPWIVRLLIAHQRGLHVRRDEFDHFHLCLLELVTE